MLYNHTMVNINKTSLIVLNYVVMGTWKTKIGHFRCIEARRRKIFFPFIFHSHPATYILWLSLCGCINVILEVIHIVTYVYHFRHRHFKQSVLTWQQSEVFVSTSPGFCISMTCLSYTKWSSYVKLFSSIVSWVWYSWLHFWIIARLRHTFSRGQPFPQNTQNFIIFSSAYLAVKIF